MQPADVQKLSPKIAVIGVGGAGGNAVNNMVSSGLEGCEFLVCNTDAQALEGSLADNKIQLGANVTGGLGAGSKPEVGEAAAEESLEEVMQHLDGANMAFVTAGMGGGTGTGAAPVIAKACRERGILTVGVVTKPFHFEGSHRMKSAEAGLEKMQEYVDTLIVIPNQNLFRVANENTTFAEGFKMADSVLQSGVRGVTDLIVRPGLVNLDFADIRTAMLEMGKAMMGTGEAEGEKRAVEAAESAINNPLLDDVSMKGAHGVIINVTGGYDMTLFEADEACNRIRDEVDPNANIIFGATFDQNLEGTMRVSIIATGIEKESAQKTRGGSGALKTDGVSRTTLERATPNTQDSTQKATQEPVSANAPIAPSTQSSTGFVSTSPAAASAPAPESVKSDTALDAFDQREFPITQDAVEPTVARNTALRGTRYKDSFIPPKPAEVSAQENTASSFHGGAQSAAMSQSAIAAAPAPSAPAHTTSPGLQLNPPKLPTNEKTRSPSLFERITGTVQQTIEGIKEEYQPQPQASRQRVAPSPTVGTGAAGTAPAQPAQGSLNIDAPAKPGADDQLDIPAFLRRQAN